MDANIEALDHRVQHDYERRQALKSLLAGVVVDLVDKGVEKARAESLQLRGICNIMHRENERGATASSVKVCGTIVTHTLSGEVADIDVVIEAEIAGVMCYHKTQYRHEVGAV